MNNGTSFFKVMTEVRGTISRLPKLLFGLSMIVLLLCGYTSLSYRQHTINVNDNTIPTWTQMFEGTVNVCQDIYSWDKERYKIEGANLRMFPTVGDIAGGVHQLRYNNPRGERRILGDFAVTIWRLLKGLAVGSAIGIFLGMFMGVFAIPEAIFRPTFTFIDKIPPTASMAIFFVLTEGENMYTTIIAVGIVPVLALSVCDAIKDVPMELIHKAQTLGASKMEMVWTIVFPTVLPKISASIQYLTANAVVFLIAAEMLAGSSGVGYRIRLEQRGMRLNVVYPYLVTLGIMVGLFVGFLRGVDRIISPWHHAGGK
jgi:NitT/TauT family transport system permease protein